MYHISISPKAKKELKQISIRYRNAISEAVDTLENDPYLGKPLSRELAGMLAYKIGVYRIIYKVDEKDKTIVILTAGHRATVYK